jgi:hypothetical protein
VSLAISVLFSEHLNAVRDGKKKCSPPRSTLTSRCRGRGVSPVLRDREGCAFLLQADVGIALVAQAHEIAVVDPLLLQERHRRHGLGTNEDEVQAAGYLVGVRRSARESYGAPKGVLRRTVRWMFTSVRSAISLSRGFIRRVCEPRGTCRPSGSAAYVKSFP